MGTKSREGLSIGFLRRKVCAIFGYAHNREIFVRKSGSDDALQVEIAGSLSREIPFFHCQDEAAGGGNYKPDMSEYG